MFEVQEGHVIYNVLVIKTKNNGEQRIDKIQVPAFNEAEALTKIPVSDLKPQGFANVTVQIAD
ncbi:MAG: hypothetical protein MK137_09530 [Rickettsiales bacterium]|nr:hypothetical protein [Rickettsiales bacterium]